MSSLQNAIQHKDVGAYRISIMHDEDPINPNDWDQVGVLITNHSRYQIGEKLTPMHKYLFEHSAKWHDKILREDLGAVVYLPVYMMDHSGISINTKPYGCPWDSGQIGYIYTTRKLIIDMFDKTYVRLTKSRIQRISSILELQVDTMSKYLNGEVYGYVINKIQENGSLEGCGESCWGYFDIEYATQDAEAVITYLQRVDTEIERLTSITDYRKLTEIGESLMDNSSVKSFYDNRVKSLRISQNIVEYAEYI